MIAPAPAWSPSPVDRHIFNAVRILCLPLESLAEVVRMPVLRVERIASRMTEFFLDKTPLKAAEQRALLLRSRIGCT